jgi:hypothetical protein
MNRNFKTTGKNLFAAAIVLLAGGSILAQQGKVGINTTNPKATLDVTAKTKTSGSAEGIIAPRLTGNEIRAKNNDYDLPEKGTIIYALSADSAPEGKTANITAEGYYYFDGQIWQAMKTTQSADIPEPWYIVGSTNKATDNTQNIYHGNGTNVKVGIGDYSGNGSSIHANSTLEINGTSTNKESTSGTNAIDFTKSNLAYSPSTSAAPTFNCTGLKDGGTYTLSWQGNIAGTGKITTNMTETRMINNTDKKNSEHAVYTIVCINTTAYVYVTIFPASTV